MKKYEEYRITSLEWFPHIPQQWEWLYLSQVCKEQKIKNKDNIENNVLSLSYGNVIKKKNVDSGLTPKDYAAYQIVDKDNIILRLTDLQNDHRSLRTGYVSQRGIITSAYACLTPSIDSKYLHYVLHSYDCKKVFYGMGSGVRQSMGFKDIKQLRIPVPSDVEQTQIVKYLDWKVAKINKYIKAKKRQIELLKELKQAEINRAVTKGLDPTVPMKDSGVDWIGKIPEHWEYRPIKSLFRSNQDSLNEKLDPTCNISYIDISSVGFGFLKLPPETYYFKDAPLRARRKVKEGDIIISTVRTYLKSMCYITSDLSHNIVSTGFSVLTPKAGVNSQYYQYGIFADYLVDEIIKKSVGISYPAINDDKLLSIKIVSPSNNDEKIIITEYLTNLSQKIDKAVSKVKCQLESIEEYKKSLISDVVTGKVDVREVVVPENYEVESIAEDIKDDGEVLETIN